MRPGIPELEIQVDAARRALREDRTAAARENLRRAWIALKVVALGLDEPRESDAAAEASRVQCAELAMEAHVADTQFLDACLRQQQERSETADQLVQARIELAVLKWKAYKRAVETSQKRRNVRLGRRKGCSAEEVAEFVNARRGEKFDVLQREGAEAFGVSMRTFAARVAEARERNLLQER